MFALVPPLLILGVLTGWLRGGSLGGLTRIRLQALWLVGAALVFHVLIVAVDLQVVAPSLALILLLLAGRDLALLGFLVANRHVPGWWWLAAGWLANGLVRALNGGQMPVDPQALQAVGVAPEAIVGAAPGVWSAFTLVGPHTVVPWLGDVIALGPPFPWPRLLSPGDCLLAIGLAWGISQAMQLGSQPIQRGGVSRGGASPRGSRTPLSP